MYPTNHFAENGEVVSCVIRLYKSAHTVKIIEIILVCIFRKKEEIRNIRIQLQLYSPLFQRG